MESKVCEFIDTEKKCWDLDLLNQTFIPFEAEAIAGIPLSVRLPDVKQVWSETSNGFFIVRSAYKLALELEVNREKGSYVDDTMMRQFWRCLWSIQIPHKIRHFACHVACAILLTKKNLVRRNVLVNSTSEECGRFSETLFHLFWKCPKARDTWNSSSLLPLLSSVSFRSFFDFLGYILMDACWGMEELGLAVTVVWALWNNRNEVRHGKLRKASPGLINWCKLYLEEYWFVSDSPSQATPQLDASWVPPSYPLYKVNVDGAVFSN
nr:putative ribonuclease h protein [Quercus suber]